MKYAAMLRAIAVSLACLGLLIPTPVLYAATAPTTSAPPVPQAIDVGLHEGGLLFGQVVDAQGRPQAQLPVSLVQQDRVVTTATTDKSGYFLMPKVPAGTYRVVAAKTQGVYRLWAPKTAPPAAQPGAMLVVGQGPVRAQQGPVGYWLGQPWVIAGLIAAAIAIPVIIHNNQADKDSTPASP
ncbi:MAG: carboxypeptidase-like regulatory domain-containing protein [Planctomycetia bacterium]|nr:carboxypeptidase-like regulatory domain-containing protein [Planctomycetia bacterium]